MPDSDPLKDAATAFLRLAAKGDVDAAYERYVATGFRHHNPFFRGDAESLREGMRENALQNPGKVLEVQRALRDGDLVAVHSRVRQQPDDPDVAVVHLFRFENGRIAELWDVGQPQPERPVNEHGMF